jgi:Tol biopolymer transport system component
VKSLQLRFILLSCLAPGVVFSALAAAQNASQPAPKYRTHFVTYDVQKKTTSTLFTLDGEWHAPNWTADGKYIVSDMGNALYRIPVSGADAGKPEKIYANASMIATNDHAVSWDGKQIADTVIKLPMPAKIRSAADIPNPILVMNLDGSAAHEVHMGWLHGWSPDGKYLVYAGTLQDSASIYRINADGSGELRMTTTKGADDGPEYSADGKWVYFCSNRSGKWDAWRMPAAGAGPDDKLAEKVTSGADTQDWFPHISPDGKWLYTVSYPKDHPDHDYIGDGMKIKLLRLKDGVGAKGAELATVRTFFGGQGAGNTGGWSMDSKRFTWTEYEKIQPQAK